MKKSIIHIFVTVLSILFITACTHHDPRCASMPISGQYCLQPSYKHEPFDAQQKVDISFKENHETMIASIENDAAHLSFAGLTPFGQKLIHIQYDNQKIDAITLPDKRLDPTMMIALLQLALWPVDTVREGLSKSLAVNESNSSRTISNRGHTIMEIHYENSEIPYDHLQIDIPSAQLKLEIQSLPKENLD